MDHTTRPELLAEVREVRILWIIRKFRLLLRVEVVEVAVELVKPVIGWQLVVPVTEMVLAELSRHVPLPFEKFCDRHISRLQAQRRARHAHFGVPGSQSALARDERGATCRAALLAVVVGEYYSLLGDSIDVGGLIAH